MEDDTIPPHEQARALARLAALQRLKDEMQKNNRDAMRRSIEHLMELESLVLRTVKAPQQS